MPITMCQLTALLAFAAISTFACGQGEAPGPWLGSIDTLPSGTIRTVNPAQGIWNRRTAWRIAENLRIGSLDGGPEEFDRIVDLDVDDWGRIYVLLDRRAEIRVFDERGNYVRTIGRRGGGPGEFRAPVSLDIDSLGQIWVTDPMNLRYTVFDSTGTFRFGRSRHSKFSTFGGVRGDRVGVDGALFDADVHASAPSVFEYRFFKLDTAFTPIDTIIVPRGNRTPSTRPLPFRPYSPRGLYSLDLRGYVWYGVSTTYEVFQLGFSGDTVRSVGRDFEPQVITDAERASIAEASQRGNREIGIPGSRSSPDIPTHKPAIARIFVDSRGYLWVVPYGEVDGETHNLDVFDPDGKYLGQATADFPIGLEPSGMPAVLRGTPIVIRGDNLYAVTFDDLDVPFVVRARIQVRR